MKKVFLFFAIVFATSAVLYGQEIKYKKDTVYVDGKACLRINNSDPNNVSILDLKGNELILLRFIHNSRYGRLYNKVIFLDQKLSFTSQSYIYTKKLLIKKLVEDKTIENCSLNAEKVERFVLKYDENIEKE